MENMDTVILDKKEYTKASVAAKQFRYTSDYIGQLCRSNKVDARLVGRTWFVSLDSLTEHKSNKHAKSKLKAKYKKSALPDEEAVRVPVSPVFTNKAAKSITSTTTKRSTKTRDLKVSYDVDDGHLIPSITRKVVKPPKTVRVELADSQKIRISGKKEAYAFSAEAQPEVALSGIVKVQPLPESEPEPEVLKDTKNTIENITISDKEAVSKKLVILDKEEIISEDTEVEKEASRIEEGLQKKKALTKQAVLETKTPESTNEIPFTDSVPEKAQPIRISTAVLLSPLIATVLALVCVSVIFSASSSVVVTNESYQSKVLIQVANLVELFK